MTGVFQELVRSAVRISHDLGSMVDPCTQAAVTPKHSSRSLRLGPSLMCMALRRCLGYGHEQVPGEKIKQAWRFKHWPAGHFSDVTLEIKETDDKSRLTLTQTGVPEADLESCKVAFHSGSKKSARSFC